MNNQISPYVFPGKQPDNRIRQAIHSSIVLDAVCAYFKVDRDWIRIHDRLPFRVRVRQITIHLLLQVEGMPYRDIIIAVGLRNHTTIIHHKQTALDMIETCDSYREDVWILENMIQQLKQSA
jgi:chromosomal replication initiation ATPase DnaA